MSATTINCRSGHSNSPTQKFCGECGVSLAGVCPNGHQNPDGQKFCGECGQPLGLPGELIGAATAEIDQPKSATLDRTVESAVAQPGQAKPLGSTDRLAGEGIPKPPSSAQVRSETGSAAAGTLRVGDRISLSQGLEAIVVEHDADMVSLDVVRGDAHYGVSKYPLRDIEAALTVNRIAVIQRAPATPGWYPDPRDAQTESFWDGQRWRGGRRRDMADKPSNSMPKGGVDSTGSNAPGGSTSGIQAWWAKLQTWAKVAVVGVPVMLLVVLILVLSSLGRDPASYNYGRTTATGWALPLWEGAITKPQYAPKIKTERDACRFVVEINRDNVTPVEMRKLKDRDIIDGCTDELEKLTRQAGLRR